LITATIDRGYSKIQNSMYGWSGCGCLSLLEALNTANVSSPLFRQSYSI
jgi:hypothetical protein